MAKTATQSDLSPFVFGPGLPVYEDHVQAVAENLNYVAGESPTLYFSLITGQNGWGLAGSVGPHNVIIQATSGIVTFYEGKIWIDPDEQEITVGAEFHGLATINEVEVSWTVGSASQVVGYDAGDNETELTHTFATSSTGTGWKSFKIQIEHTAGSSSSIYLFSIRCEAEPIAATDLPSPTNE